MRGSEVVARALLGTDGVEVSVNGKVYTISSPTIECIALVTEALCGISLKSNVSSVLYMSFHVRCWALALSRMIRHDDTLVNTFLEARIEEVVNAVEKGLSLVSTKDFDKTIVFDKEKSDNKSETIGNSTMLGQIATFMENLHLSYDEVYRKIPYRNLLMMQRDKLHVCYGTKITKASGAEMARRRTAAINEMRGQKNSPSEDEE